MASLAKKSLKKKSHLVNYAVITASIIVILAGIQAAKAVLSPILMATFFSVILVPPLRYLRSKGLSQITSLAVVILSVIVVGGSLITILTTQLNQFSKDLPSYSRRFNDVLMNYNVDLTEIFPFLEKREEGTGGSGTDAPADDPNATSGAYLPIPISRRTSGNPSVRPVTLQEPQEPTPVSGGTGVAEPDRLTPLSESVPPETTSVESSGERSIGLETGESAPQSSLSPEGAMVPYARSLDMEEDEPITPPKRWEEAPEKVVKLSSQQLFSFLKGFVGELTLLASNAFIVLLLIIFMLIEAAHLPEKMAVALAKRQNQASERLIKVMNDIRRYMMIKTFVSILVGLFVTILLTVMGVQYPMLWGVIAFFLNFIPNIGSVVAAIPPIILATVDQGVVSGVIATIFFVLINTVIGYALEPKLLGDGLDLSPLVVLLSLILCGWFLGPVGMFLSPPLAVISKIILQSFPETRWIAILMANNIPDPDSLEEEN